jgi:glutathione S-transferase
MLCCSIYPRSSSLSSVVSRSSQLPVAVQEKTANNGYKGFPTQSSLKCNNHSISIQHSAINMQRLRLWYSPNACSLAVHIVLRETGLPFEPIRTKIGNQPGDSVARLPDQFRDINPKMRVPVLAIDDEVITELPAIMLAVSNLAPGLNLTGSSTMNQNRTFEWLSYLSSTLHSVGFGGFWRPQRFVEEPELFPNVSKKAHKTILECYETIEGKLSGIHSVGDSFTVADAFLCIFWRWGKQRLGIDMEQTYPKFTDLAQNVMKRETAQAAIVEEGLKA